MLASTIAKLATGVTGVVTFIGGTMYSSNKRSELRMDLYDKYGILTENSEEFKKAMNPEPEQVVVEEPKVDLDAVQPVKFTIKQESVAGPAFTVANEEPKTTATKKPAAKKTTTKKTAVTK